MNKENTINEKEARDAIYEALKEDGVKVTKDLLDKVLDKATDLAIAGAKKGYGIKFQGLGTLTIVNMKERNYKVPDGKGGWVEGTTPAHKTIHFKISDKLKQEMNTLLD